MRAYNRYPFMFSNHPTKEGKRKPMVDCHGKDAQNTEEGIC